MKAFARAVGLAHPLERIVERGCGGGANAVAFAPHCAEYLGADLGSETVDECEKQLTSACDTPFRGLHAAERGGRPLIGVTVGVCQVVPRCRRRRSRWLAKLRYSSLAGPGRLVVPTRPVVVRAASHPSPHLQGQAAPELPLESWRVQLCRCRLVSGDLLVCDR